MIKQLSKVSLRLKVLRLATVKIKLKFKNLDIMNNNIFLVLLVIPFLFCSCETVPYSGRSQLMMVTMEQEQQMGSEAWTQVSKQNKISNNKKYTEALSRVGKSIAKESDRPEFKWEFKVFESDEANAFCLPGGKVAVYSGLFKYLANDAELATVVAHEVGHAIARHGAERMSHDMLQQTGANILDTAVGQSGGTSSQLWMAAYAGISNIGVVLPYSREQEFEADKIGMILMSKAGYNPQAALDFWNKFSTISKQSAIEEFFSTHPMSTKRQEEMRKMLPDANLRYKDSNPKKNFGIRY